MTFSGFCFDVWWKETQLWLCCSVILIFLLFWFYFLAIKPFFGRTAWESLEKWGERRGGDMHHTMQDLILQPKSKKRRKERKKNNLIVNVLFLLFLVRNNLFGINMSYIHLTSPQNCSWVKIFQRQKWSLNSLKNVTC